MHDENELIRLIKDGDQAAWWCLIEAHHDSIRNWCYRFVMDHDAADDLTGDFISWVWDRRSKFHGKSTFKTWLYRVTMNFLINQSKRRKNEQQRLVSFDENAPFGETEGAGVYDDAFSDPTHDTVVENMRKQLLRELVASEEEPNRSILRLRAYEKMSFEGIACELNMSLKAVHGRWRNIRGRKNNQELIAKLRELEG